MKRFAFAAVALALAVSSVLAGPPDVPATLKAKPGQLVRVTVKADPDKLGALRNFTDSEAFWGELVGPKGTRQFVFQAPALEYDKDGAPVPPAKTQFVIGWWTAGELDGVTTTIVLDFEEAKPKPKPVPPGPGPGPGPKPEPAPVAAGKRFVVVVEETSSAVPARGLMMADPELSARMKDKGHKWRVVDQDNKTSTGEIPADMKPYLDEARGKKLPRLYIVAPDGTVCWYGDAPTGSDAAAKVLELLKANGG